MATFTQANGGKWLVFGMTWVTVANTRSERNKAAAQGKKFAAEYKAVLLENKTAAYGFIAHTGPITRTPKKGELLSAAALFASLVRGKKPSVLLYRMPDGKRVAIVAIDRDLPYVDVVVPADAPDNRLKDLYAETGTTAGDWEFYSNMPGLYPEYDEVDADRLLKLLPTAKSAALSKFVDNTLLNSVLVLVALCAVGIVGHQLYAKHMERMRQAEADANAVDPLVAYQAQIQQILPTLGFPGQNAISSLLDPLGVRSTELGGWSLDNVKCDKSGQCSETWSLNSGTNATFAEANKIGKQRFSADGKTLTNTFRLQTVPTKIVQAALPEKEAFWLEFTSLMQRYQTIGMVYSLTQPALLNGVSNLNVPPGTGVLQGGFTLAGPLGLATETLASFPQNVAIADLKLVTNGDLASMKFEIKGNFYVKN